MILSLADSFEPGEPLRDSLLAAAPVQRILGEPYHGEPVRWVRVTNSCGCTSDLIKCRRDSPEDRHLWRQRFRNGVPEQITFGATEEEGLAAPPDGRSLITSAGIRESAVWIHDRSGKRALSTEGYVAPMRISPYSSVKFSADGKLLFYLLRRDSQASGTELWRTDLVSAKTEPVLRGVPMTEYGLLIPCVPDAGFLEMYRVPEHRNLVHNAIRYLNPKPPIRVEGPVNVETVLTHDSRNNRFLVDSICFSAPPTAATEVFGKGRNVLPPVMEEPTWYEITITSREGFSKVRATNPKSRLSVNGRQVHLLTNAIHEVTILES